MAEGRTWKTADQRLQIIPDVSATSAQDIQVDEPSTYQKVVLSIHWSCWASAANRDKKMIQVRSTSKYGVVVVVAVVDGLHYSCAGERVSRIVGCGEAPIISVSKTEHLVQVNNTLTDALEEVGTLTPKNL